MKKELILTEEQKESLKFYVTNDYLLVNALLWNEDIKVINELIDLINMDGRGVMKEALEMGFDIRWNCSKEEGERKFKVFEKRFPLIDSEEVRNKIISRAKQDIDNMMSSFSLLKEDIVVYRNIKTKYISDIKENSVLEYKGFSSCSLMPHIPENASYGSKGSTLFEIEVPKGTPIIRIDLLEDIRNEEDEVILPPISFKINHIDKEKNKVFMRVINNKYLR